MNTDTLSIIFKSSVDKVKNSAKTMINMFQQYSNTLNTVANSMNKVENNTTNYSYKLIKTKQQLKNLKTELNGLIHQYNEHLDIHRKWGDLATPTESIPTKEFKNLTGTNLTNRFGEPISMKSLQQELDKINELKATIKELETNISDTSEKSKNVISKEPSRNLKEIGKEANDSRKKVNLFSASMSKIGGIARSVGSKGFDFLKNKFKDFTKGFSKSVDGNIKEIRKLALGLIGVRTAMSVLTKSVNAYLSFDSALQDSLTNSWNMLGSLLAPAIEFVARMFALATNYIAQFVNALTGVNLVARANAKALNTQAKATKGVGEAQRGLLGMDEITNLPTEPSGAGGSSAPQIQMDDSIKSFKALDDILRHLKDGQWHLVGEDIAKGINRLLYSINWKDLKKKAYRFGYNFGDFLNGLFEVDWSQIGTTFAETLNTWNKLVRGFVDKFSFIQLGKGLGNMLTRSILDVDWKELAETINKTVQGIASGIATFLMVTDWGGIGQSFAEFVKTIDWGGILFQAIRISILAFDGFREFLANFLVTLFWDVIEPIKEPLIMAGEELYNYIDGLLDNIVSIFKTPIDYIINSVRNLISTIKSMLQGDLLGFMKGVGKGFGNAIIYPLNNLINGINKIAYPIRELLSLLAEASGRSISAKSIKIPNIPTLATGTPNIETEGLYHLHEGEMVVPKRYNPNTDGYDNGMDNKQIIDLLVSLNASMLEYAERPININMNSRKVAEATYDDMQQIDRNRNKSTAVVRS